MEYVIYICNRNLALSIAIPHSHGTDTADTANSPAPLR